MILLKGLLLLALVYALAVGFLGLGCTGIPPSGLRAEQVQEP